MHTSLYIGECIFQKIQFKSEARGIAENMEKNLNRIWIAIIRRDTVGGSDNEPQENGHPAFLSFTLATILSVLNTAETLIDTYHTCQTSLCMLL